MIDWDRYLAAEWENLGRDWPRVDCYGHLKEFYLAELGIDLGDKPYDDARNVEQVAGLILKEKLAWVEVDEPGEGDVVLMREDCPYATHVAIARTPRLYYSMGPGGMLIIDRGRQVMDAWVRPRIDGFYRHKERSC